jgi:patatin-like phospholipase/acyl hydrolase
VFRILSLDGGGIMGAFTAGVLSAFDKVARDETGKDVADQFDLITGTSIGGITAIGLGMGATPDRILQLYRQEGAGIFPRASGVTGWAGGFFHSLFGPKYTSDALRKAVEGVVGDATLAKARTRLVIPTYDAIRGRVYVFKTPHADPPDTRDADKRAANVDLATSAAPTYFPAHAVPERGAFVDGGV